MNLDENLLKSLVAQIASFESGDWAGKSNRDIHMYSVFEEDGLKLTLADIPLAQCYAGLAVLVRDMHLYLMRSPRDDSKWLQEVVASVEAKERQLHYGSGAYPYLDPSFPYRVQLSAFPEGLAEKAANGHPTVEGLGSPEIRHEWTVKPGVRLFNRIVFKFGTKFKEVVCGKNGPYQKFEDHLLGLADLPVTIAAAVFAAGLTPATFWYPLAGYVGLLLVRAGLKTYCE